MIMKNEEDELPIVLSSVVGMVDEIVIYDTGSKDRSVALARELGATVIEGHWDDDFSRARNVALACCSGEWVLWLDADEAIHGDGLAFRAGLQVEQAVDAYLVPIESIEGSGLGVRSAFHAARVFRREACHWRGRIHEQIARRDDDSYPATRICSELRILHRGYTALKWDAKSLIERNLQIAKSALLDPSIDHSLALFDFGRTLTETDDPKAAIAPLREAASTTSLATVRRTALRNIFYVHLQCREFSEAESVLDELRAQLADPVGSNVLLAKLLLWRGDFEACLEAVERLPFSATDEDGFEFGRASVAWVKAHALDALDRPGLAADALLDALRTHGQLDESLGSLVGLLRKAGRSASEIATMARAETMPVLAANAALLPASFADEVLAAFAERYPDRLEPLAAAKAVAPKLDIARAMFWSQRLRHVGLHEHCPLVAIVNNAELEPLFRLLAAAGGFRSFHDQRLVPPARSVFAGPLGLDHADALEQVRAISPELAQLLEQPSVAVHLSRRGAVLEGFLNFAAVPATDETDLLDHLPLADSSVHELLVDDVLGSVPHDRALTILLEWSRVLSDGGLLRLEVPNLEAVVVPAASPTELRRLLYGGRRYGQNGEDEANEDAWTEAELRSVLPSLGFDVEGLTAGDVITVTARRLAVESHLATGPAPSVSVLVASGHGRDSLLQQLRMLASTEPGIDFETVVLVNGPDKDARSLRAALTGDVSFAGAPSILELSVALNEAARLARGSTLVVLSDGARLSEGWLRDLVGPLADPTVGIAGAAVVDEHGLVVNAGFDLVGDAALPKLDAVPRSAYLDAKVTLKEDAEVDAVGADLFAVRSSLWREMGGLRPGWTVDEAVIDLALRMREDKLRCVIAAGSRTSSAHARDRPLTGDRFAWRWAGRTELRPPSAPHISASSLMPSSTLIERVSNVMAVTSSPRIGGVNLIGDFGDARVHPYLDTLTTARVPTAQLQWSGGMPVPVGDLDPFAFSTTLLCLDGDQLVDYIGEVGLDTLKGRHTIVAWEWPLEKPPPNAVAETSMVSEVWVPSTFSERAFDEVSPRPVIRLPPRIVVSTNLTRTDAHMPEGFVFAAIARLGRERPGDVALANPTAVVSAFCSAFEAESGPMLQVVLHGKKTRTTAQACLAEAAGRTDVLVVETDDAVVAEAASVTADSLISLHRSSSFGPDIARALAAGHPVISTAYGGPMDYLSPAWAELVPYILTRSETDLHPFAAGTTWAEPDLDAAGQSLRSVYADYNEVLRRAQSGVAAITKLCGPKSADGAMLHRLRLPINSPRSHRRTTSTSRR
jgi:hypothetical protein